MKMQKNIILEYAKNLQIKKIIIDCLYNKKEKDFIDLQKLQEEAQEIIDKHKIIYSTEGIAYLSKSVPCTSTPLKLAL